MRKARGWAVATVVVVLGLAACSGGGKGGTSGKVGQPIGDAGIKVAEVAARAGAGRQPVDAAPSPDGAVIYFAATGDTGPGLYRVPAGGGTVSTITEGAPLGQPSGLAVASDGSRLYVADHQTGQAAGAAAGGGILTVPVTRSAPAPTLLPGTSGRAPRGLDLVNKGGADILYFTGTDPANGAPGLFQIPAAGGPVVTIAEGAPFASPDSVVVASGGGAYVSDQGRGPGQGQVLAVSGGHATPVLSGLHLGTPGGVTLAHGGATLLVSSIDPTNRSDQLLFLDLATGRTAPATKVIGANKDSSGGLHRALNAPILAWCDVGRNGKVYRVEP